MANQPPHKLSYQVLARKWRPQSFGQVKGQEQVVKVLTQGLQSNKIAQAYLFTGTRGVGKTTLARVFAKALNCTQRSANGEPCLKCSSCLDIQSGNSLDYQELDGASNNGVENVRQIIDQIQYQPVIGPYKVFVIDEVHMLSNNAFNALLKTLEEPPAHGIFIFATTDPQKIPETVLSRCLRLDLRAASSQTLNSVVQEICQQEGIEFTDEQTLEMLIESGQGSMRDVLSLLEQARMSASADMGRSRISREHIHNILGLAPEDFIESLVKAIYQGNAPQLKQAYQEVFQNNIDLEKFALQIYKRFTKDLNEMIDNQVPEFCGLKLDELFWLHETFSKDLSWILSSIEPRSVLFLALQKLTLRRQILGSRTVSSLSPNQLQESNNQVAHKAEQKKKLALPSWDKKSWYDFVAELSKHYPSTAAALEQTQFQGFLETSEEGYLQLELMYHQSNESLLSYLEDKDVDQTFRDYLGAQLEKEFPGHWQGIQKVFYKGINDSDFESIADIRERREQERKQNLVQGLKSHPTITTAEKIFGVQIDKVHLK